jgi:SAM-dependent methyltransferase
MLRDVSALVANEPEMKLAQVKRHWNAFGKRDPFWAILTHPDKRDGKWTPEEFFQTGWDNIAEVLARLESLRIAGKRDRALDFGCGAGRLTRAIAAHYNDVVGVDIAPSMIELARDLDPPANCHFMVNERSDLRQFADQSFDFIYSLIVLQHLEPQYSLGYLREFLRVLAPSGVLVFQLPCAEFQYLQDGQNSAAFAITEPLGDWNAGTDVTVNAMIRNPGPSAWPGDEDAPGAPTRVLYSWTPRPEPDARSRDTGATLPTALGPRREKPLSLRIRIPNKPGKYILNLGLEGWDAAGFASSGISIVVGGSRLVTAWVDFRALVARFHRRSYFYARKIIGRPVMEMYGIDQQSVVKRIRDFGGRVIHVERDFWSGPHWLSYTYYVTK